ncbi:hypothetical protein [Photorhabdus viridis]|uniref:hypothetical protein n=1 Tax=Photorhabdus viridis TaxID=3163327 RepID=UPI0033072A65
MKLSDVGNIVLLKVDKFRINDNRVFSKCEYQNPISSHKDRIFFYIVHALEKEGNIPVIIEDA